MDKGKVLSETESLCPECFKKIPALRVQYGKSVYLEKDCPDHGHFKSVIWRGTPGLSEWSRPKIPSTPAGCFTEAEKGCPFDCGLCSDHGQHTCTALLEITGRCNLKCPVCFAASGEDSPEVGESLKDPDLSEIRFWYERVREAGGNCNIQLSGGEPTMRDDLPEIIELGKKTGFEFIQLNTNGIRLAGDKSFADKLARAGLSSIFLQFDGTSDEIYRKIRGKALLETKKKAIENCAKAGIGIVLVPTVIPGVNSHDIGEIIRFGLDLAPAVRGVHFQPVSYFGRYPKAPADKDRITIPELMDALEKQSNGLVAAENFKPPGCEHSLCSFHGNYMIMPGGGLKPITGESGKSCCTPPIKAEEGARQAISSVARQWAAPETPECGCEKSKQDDLDIFLQRAKTHIFAISGMAFQDVWNVDIERLKGCCIHTVTPDGNLVPFCAYNLTDSKGKNLYRGRKKKR